ncbi:Recombination endonuclease VII [Geodermatophilus sabuli]|uniref:Recombination endonuclease VII n=1 Tax=Geodermatophilus sabuli TaxID=1564158 RepID=A0A285EBW1_9ACTN|nr:Recombination endonuclease VII [Geodermatophilus sabuli]
MRRVGLPTRRHPGDREVPDGFKWCPDCAVVKPVTDFPRSRASPSGTYTYCKPCHNVRGRESKAKVGGSRTYHLKRRYGISAEDADAMLEAQGGLCAICRSAPALHVDHDHGTGAVRALLCFNCNGGLGQFRDDPFLLRMAAFYVEGHRQRQAMGLLEESAGNGPGEASRPGSPPVGSQRRPGRPRTPRSTGRHTSGERRQGAAGEADT